MATAKIGTFEELLEMAEAPLRPIMEQLRSIIMDIHADACEVVRLGDRAATYGLGPKKMSEGYTYILPHKKWVNLGFFYGAMLDDPAERLEGTGAKMRHVKIRSLDDASGDDLRTLIEAALAERRATLGR